METDELIHFWDGSRAPSACGVDIWTTYTFGSPVPTEVTCPDCLPVIAEAQVEAWRERHGSLPRIYAYWMIDAREADHAEAVAEDIARSGWTITEALCERCGETFIVNEVTADVRHFADSDGRECDGAGTILGSWR